MATYTGIESGKVIKAADMVDALDRKVEKSGDTMTGLLTFNVDPQLAAGVAKSGAAWATATASAIKFATEKQVYDFIIAELDRREPIIAVLNSTPAGTVRLSKFERGAISGGSTSWYKAVKYAATQSNINSSHPDYSYVTALNSAAEPNTAATATVDAMKPYENYLIKAVTNKWWRLPTEAELEYDFDKMFEGVPTSISYLWAIDAYDGSGHATTPDPNPVRWWYSGAGARMMRTRSIGASGRLNYSPWYDYSGYAVRLVRTV